MKLVRFGPAGQEKPGLVDARRQIRDLSWVVPDVNGVTLSRRGLDKLRALDLLTLPAAPVGGAPRPSRCAAGPFRRRRPELRRSRRRVRGADPGRTDPVQQGAPSSVGPDDDVIIPRASKKPDWEVELAFVIGRRASYVEEGGARLRRRLLVCNDVSEREFQIERGGQWIKGKGARPSGRSGRGWSRRTRSVTRKSYLGLM